MIQKAFATHVSSIIKDDPAVLGLAAGGSWISGTMDEYSDLDLLLITREKISGNKQFMLAYAGKFGTLLSAFTGEHVGEPRLLICLFDQPLLHVDIKFLTLPELTPRVEDPVVLFERDQQVSSFLSNSTAHWPVPDLQLMEDRFWVWIHYTCLKIGRGEYFESLNALADFRRMILGPLYQLKKNIPPNGVRRLESILSAKEIESLASVSATYSPSSVMQSLENCILLYKELRTAVFPKEIRLNTGAEKQVMNYVDSIRNKFTGA